MIDTANDARRKANTILFAFAAIYFGLEWLPGSFGHYGYFIDEFYYVACARHLAFGYVDHPPLSIFLLNLLRGGIGDSLWAIRILPALAGAATVFLIGLIARRLGADIFGQLIAAGAAMTAPVFHVLFGFNSMNAVSILLWTWTLYLLIEIERRNEPRLWLIVGLLAGLGLENKHTFLLLLLGMAVAMLLTPARRHFRGRWLWMGAGIATLLFLPNLGWQWAHGWPSLEFYRNADLYKNIATPPLEILKQQVLFMNPGTFPVWVAGIIFFLVTREGHPYRHIGWIFVILLLLMLVGQKSRPDRISDIYTVLFGAGGVALGRLSVRSGMRWIRIAMPALLLVTGAALAPIGLPLLSPASEARYMVAVGLVPQLERGEGKESALPQWLADRLDWEPFVDHVADAARRIDPALHDRAIVLVPTYGQAGALELLGRGRHLPPVYASQNNYFLWGPPPNTPAAAIITGPFDEGLARWLFGDVELADVCRTDWCMSWRREVPIWIARDPIVPMQAAWPRFRHYE